MRGRVLWGLPLGLLVAYVALSVGGLAVLAHTPSDLRPKGESLFFDSLLTLVLLVFLAVGILVVSRQPRNPIGWLFCALPVANAAYTLSVSYGNQALVADPGSLPAGQAAAWFSSWGDFFIPLVAFLFLLFPDGRLPSKRWRGVAWLVAAATLAGALGGALQPGPLDEIPGVDNPLGIEAWGFLRRLDIGPLLAWPALLAAPFALAGRMRRAGPEQRQQIKWFVFSAALVVMCLPVATVTTELVAGGEAADTAAGVVFAILLVGVAVSTGIGILRHRLYDIDVVINRTLVYGALTALLAATYIGTVLLLQLVLRPLTEKSDLAIAGSTLAVAALVRPALRRIQELVDRRFYRRKYDAQRTLEAFSGRLRDEVDLDTLGAELRAAVRETMQPAHVSLWLRSPGGGT
jgi:hypothetical protein